MNKLPVIVIVDTNNQPEEIIIFRPTTTTTTTTATTATATTATSDSKKFKLNSTKSHTDQGTVSPRFFAKFLSAVFFNIGLGTIQLTLNRVSYNLQFYSQVLYLISQKFIFFIGNFFIRGHSNNTLHFFG